MADDNTVQDSSKETQVVEGKDVKDSGGKDVADKTPSKPAALDDPEVQAYVNRIIGATRREASDAAKRSAKESALKELGIDDSAVEELNRLRKEEQDRILETQRKRDDDLKKQQKYDELLATKESEHGTALQKKDAEIESLKKSLTDEREGRRQDRLRHSVREYIAPHQSDIFPEFVPFLEKELLGTLAFDDGDTVVALIGGEKMEPTEYVKTLLTKNAYALRKTSQGGSGTLPGKGGDSGGSPSDIDKQMQELHERARNGDVVANREYLQLRAKKRSLEIAASKKPAA